MATRRFCFRGANRYPLDYRVGIYPAHHISEDLPGAAQRRRSDCDCPEVVSRDNVHMLSPGSRHLEYLQETMELGQARGAQTTDAVLAAIAREHGATVVSTDRDFARFPNLKWKNPLADAARSRE